VGQAIAIVAAETEAQARAAAKAVQVQYEDLPAVLDIEDAIAGVLACSRTVSAHS
jgi:CO/xanthine dehydrogenase Mo-binding subunit